MRSLIKGAIVGVLCSGIGIVGTLVALKIEQQKRIQEMQKKRTGL